MVITMKTFEPRFQNTTLFVCKIIGISAWNKANLEYGNECTDNLQASAVTNIRPTCFDQLTNFSSIVFFGTFLFPFAAESQMAAH